MKYVANLLMTSLLLLTFALIYYFLFYHLDKFWTVMAYIYLTFYVWMVYFFSSWTMSAIRANKKLNAMAKGETPSDDILRGEIKDELKVYEEGGVVAFILLIFLTACSFFVIDWLT